MGEAVVALVAETAEQAKDALEAVMVEYDEQPVVTELQEATAPGAPLVWPAATGNIAAQMKHGDPAATDAGFAKAAHVVSLDLVNQRLVPVTMEPRGALCVYDKETDRLTLRLPSQMPSMTRDTLCGVLGLATDKVRVVVGDIGGGFGMKGGLYPEEIAVAYAAKQIGRPVKWIPTRIEEFLSATHGRDVESHAELALDADGKVLGYRVRSLANMGAYGSTVGIIIQLMIGPWVSTSIYDIKAIDFDFQAVLTNTAPTSAYRGAGRPEAIYLIERLFDVAAQKLGLDPAEIRRRNLIAPEQMPYTNAMGQTYDSGNFGSILEQALKLAKWDEFRRPGSGVEGARQAARARAGIVPGMDRRQRVRGTGDGRGFRRWPDQVFASTMPMGQGIETSFAQLLVDVFGVEMDRIHLVHGDTDLGTGFGSAGSRSLFTAGSAINIASEKTVANGRELAAEALEAAATDIEYANGLFRVAGTDRGIGLFELAAKQPDSRIYVDSTSTVAGPSWPNGAHICEVEVDPDTGDIEIVSYVSVNDVGRVVNPMIVRGQLDGGAVQGIGQALGEHMLYEKDSGQVMTASMMDYFVPRANIIGEFVHELDQSIPCKNNPLGVKGVGELGTIGATPAVVNAVADVLARAGHVDRASTLQMPVTPMKVWAALR